MRYWKIIEAVATGRAAQRSENARSAHEQLAAAAKKRSDAARKYQDQLQSAQATTLKVRAGHLVVRFSKPHGVDPAAAIRPTFLSARFAIRGV